MQTDPRQDIVVDLSPDLAEAERAASLSPGFVGQMAAGKAFLYAPGHKPSLIVKAERYFRQALALEPTSVEALTYVGFSLSNQGRWVEAMEIYHQALEIDPNFKLAKERFAAALQELDLVDEPKGTKRSPFTRFPETIASLGDLEPAIWANVLSHPPKAKLALTKSSSIVTVGSCFAANIANGLVTAGHPAHNLTVGEIINSSFANRELFEWALGVRDTVSDEMSSKFGRDELASLIRDADLIIYTLGVSPCFFDAATGDFVLPARGDGIRGMRSGKYVFRTTTVEENVANIKAIISLVRAINLGCKFVFSVSPVPISATLEPRSAMEADCLSKAILRVVVDQVVNQVDGCLYWPAFEIVRWLGAYVPNMYGEEDGTTMHVSERVIRLIMRLFLQMHVAREEPPEAPAPRPTAEAMPTRLEQNDAVLAAFEARDRRPTGVMIQVSAKCNISCAMCGYVGKTPNVGFISTELFAHILDDCRSYGVPSIYFETAWGEPLLHPRIFELLEMASDFDIVLSTNLTPLNERRIHRLAELNIATIQLSFCGFDRESYERVYVGAKFDHVVENLILIRRRFAARSPKTKFLINGVALENDPSLVDKTIGFLSSLGFAESEIRIQLPNNFGGLYMGGPKKGTRGIHTFKDLTDEVPDICSVLLNNPGIYVDGRVTACGCLDNSGALIIGDVRVESLRDMRYGPRFEALLRLFAAGDISRIPLCAECDVPYCSSRMIDLTVPRPVD